MTESSRTLITGKANHAAYPLSFQPLHCAGTNCFHTHADRSAKRPRDRVTVHWVWEDCHDVALCGVIFTSAESEIDAALNAGVQEVICRPCEVKHLEWLWTQP